MNQQYSVSEGAEALRLTVFTEREDWVTRLKTGRMHRVVLARPRPEVAPGIFADVFGVLWQKDCPTGEAPIPNAEALGNYSFPAVSEHFVQERMESFAVPDDGALRICEYPETLYDRLTALVGVESLQNAARQEEVWIQTLTEKICERILRIMELAMQTDFDVFLLGDTLYEKAPEALQRRYLRPYWARLYAMAKCYGKAIAQYGKTPPLDMVTLGLDMLAE